MTESAWRNNQLSTQQDLQVAMSPRTCRWPCPPGLAGGHVPGALQCVVLSCRDYLVASPKKPYNVEHQWDGYGCYCPVQHAQFSHIYPKYQAWLSEELTGHMARLQSVEEQLSSLIGGGAPPPVEPPERGNQGSPGGNAELGVVSHRERW